MKKIIYGLLLCFVTANLFSQSIKISSLPTATGKGEGTFLPVVQGGITKKLRADSIAAQAKRYADSINAIAIDSLKDYTDSVASAISLDSGQVITTKVTLSSSEILNLYGTPKTLIAAPGSGKIIRVLGAVLKLNYGTATYSGGAMTFYINGSAMITTGNGYTNASNNLDYRPSSGILTTSNMVNQPLQVQVASANPTTGDGTMDIYITYTVITL